ncbi:hypothetical protein DICSQDRAFT_91385 [Dichomitus squalens LYAD-421 SS1]|uniref:Carbohydrate esterase family 16 protein n=1 Tax=Dichomitus squalens (strain LYAD-421) TaxID=732165 RepID=R7SSL1_DICSQ|nr:uncharacterized protein DICSQDRAFT_91385 [Dichomitus squalens LYAD-421 SS1]EJF57987.1 hypothetical protein DICSQDRAFT_91385 [Dichomitus squalens LYAD-421 SS1]
MGESVVLSITDQWRSFEKIKYLVVFGDSFSSVGYTSKDLPPSADMPLGVPSPGITSCEVVNEATGEVTYEPNWVGYLSQKVNSERNAKRNADPLLVYDYAVPGDTVARMKLWQVGKEFMPTMGQHPEWAPWTSLDSLFVTWIGTNDCTWNLRLQVSSAQASLVDLFKAQTRLYNAGARNFCLIDVPPCHRFPKGSKSPRAKDAFAVWNSMLSESAKNFGAAHPDATVFIFSSWELVSRLLSDTPSTGYPTENIDHTALFVDGFHPSHQVHAILANELHEFFSHVSSSPSPKAN